MRRFSSTLFIALLASCGGKDEDPAADDGAVDGDADTDSDADSDTEPCDSVITAIDPESGDDMVPLDHVVTVELDEAVPETGPFSVAIDGVTGTTTRAADGLSLTFAPDAPFAPETTYTVDVEVCDDSDASTFTTLPPPMDTALAAGNTYALRWDDITIDEPQDPANLLDSLIPIDYVLLQIVSIDPATDVAPSAATVGTDDGAGNAVPDCDTVVQQDADFSLNPYYQFLGDLQITLDPSTSPPTVADVEDFRLQALISADGTTITSISMRGLVAPEQFFDGADCASALVQTFLVGTCEPCTISDTGQCMLLAGTAPSALVQPALDLVTACGL